MLKVNFLKYLFLMLLFIGTFSNSFAMEEPLGVARQFRSNPREARAALIMKLVQEGHFDGLLDSISRDQSPPSLTMAERTGSVKVSEGKAISLAEVVVQQGESHFENAVRWACKHSVGLNIRTEFAYQAAKQGLIGQVRMLRESIKLTVPQEIQRQKYDLRILLAGIINNQPYMVDIVLADYLQGHASSWQANSYITTNTRTGKTFKFQSPYPFAVYLGKPEILPVLKQNRIVYSDDGNSMNSALFQAVKSDDHLMVEDLCQLREGFSPGVPLAADSDAFVASCLVGNWEVIKRLMPLVKHDEAYASSLNKAITYAALGGHEWLVKHWLSIRGVNINNLAFPVLDHLLGMLQPDFNDISSYNDVIDEGITPAHIAQALRIIMPFNPKTAQSVENFKRFLDFLGRCTRGEYHQIYDFLSVLRR